MPLGVALYEMCNEQSDVDKKEKRIKDCNAALTQCLNKAGDDKTKKTLCVKSLETCLKTDGPVIFPGGIRVD